MGFHFVWYVPGGPVFPRSVESVKLSPRARSPNIEATP